MLRLTNGNNSAKAALRSSERLAKDHFPQQEQRLVGALAVEHVFGAEQADALGAEQPGDLGVFRRVGVGAHAQRAELVDDLHEALERGFSVASIISNAPA